MVKFASALTTNSAAEETGEAISASRQSFWTSRAKLRFSTSAPAKAYVIHSRPPENSWICSEEGSKAKLNRSRITTENAMEAFQASLVRSSEWRSLAAMVHT